MATRGQQKKSNALDEKKLQQAVESWLKKHRAKVQDKKLQSVVDDFVKSHRKEVGERGMRIIRRVISEGRTSAKPMTASRSGPKSSNEKPIRAENRRGPSKSTAEKAIKTATDKAKDTIKTAGSRVGALSKAGAGLGAMLYSPKLGEGIADKAPSQQTAKGKKEVPARGMSTPQPAAKKGRGDGNAEVAARRAEAKRKADASKPKSTQSDSPAGPPRTIAEAKRRGLDYFVNKEGKRRAAVTAEELEASGLSLRDYLNKKQGKTRKMAKGGYANCGASMKPTQKSSKGIK